MKKDFLHRKKQNYSLSGKIRSILSSHHIQHIDSRFIRIIINAGYAWHNWFPAVPVHPKEKRFYDISHHNYLTGK